MPKIGLLDYGSGNFGSVFNALSYLGLDPVRVLEPGQLERVSHIVLPGVGSFPAAMDRLESMGFVESLHDQLSEKGKPFLGICVGMQVLAQIGNEFCERQGLGLVPGAVNRIDTAEQPLTLPHMGWNELVIVRDCPLLANMASPSSFYFVHSYHFCPANAGDLVAYCEYGSQVTACIQRDNVFGVQFHPEKSQRDGLQLLMNFSRV